MSQPEHPRHTRLKRAVALLLTFSAGIVDIIGYITLYHTFTAHMTGTTVHLGNALVMRHWPEAVMAASVLTAFVSGSIVGRTIIEVGARKRMRNVATVTLALEAALLLAFIPAHVRGAGESVRQTAPLLAMLAAAMGLQTATLTRVGPLTVHTTFVTGMLNKLAQMISHALYAWWDSLRCQECDRPRHASRRRDALAQALFLCGIWVLYLGGAAAGTALQTAWGVRAVFVPVALVLVAIASDLVQPLSVEEEGADRGER
jgi:uncharacterized membrane protein YoaK (UPF0700 family)